MPTLTDAPCLLALTFRATRQGGGLGFVHCHQAGAALKHIWGVHGPKDGSRLDVSLTTPDTGRVRLETDEHLTLGLALPQALVGPMLAALAAAEMKPAATGAIAPGLNLSLVDVRDRLAGGRILAGPDTLLTPEAPQPLTEGILDRLATQLLDAPSLHFRLAAPLRLPAPPGEHRKRQHFADAVWFQAHLNTHDPCALFGDWLAKDNGLQVLSPGEFPSLIACGLAWLDLAYGDKTLGGVVGGLETGPVSGLGAARLLVLAHCLGVGKNRALGLGQIILTALDAPEAVAPLTRNSPLVPNEDTQSQAVRDCLAGLCSQAGPGVRSRVHALWRNEKIPSTQEVAAAFGITRTDLFWSGILGDDPLATVLSGMSAGEASVPIPGRLEIGQAVPADSVSPSPEKPSGNQSWQEVFDPTWRSGRAVYLTSETGRVEVEDNVLVIQSEDVTPCRIPLADIGRVVIVGRPALGSDALLNLLRAGIVTDVVNHSGQAVGQLAPAGYAQARMRPLQERVAQDPERLVDFARQLVSAKLHNQRRLLARHGFVVEALAQLEQEASVCLNLASLRGVEGAGARIYFQYYGDLVAPWSFAGRSYRPALGPVNALLSMTYSLIHNRLASTLLFHGFDARFGFFHQGRGRHAALASDLIEPLRVAADRLILNILHKKMISEDDVEGLGAHDVCRLRRGAWSTVIHGLEKIMASPFSDEDGEGRSLNERMDAQVRSLGGWLRGREEMVVYRMR